MIRNRSSLSEQSAYSAGLGVDVDPAVCRVAAGAGHHGDGACHRAEELGSAVLEYVSDRKSPSLGNALEGRIVGQGQVGLYHHGAVIRVLRILLEALGLLQSQRAPVYAVSTVYFLGDELDALSERGVEIVQVLDRAVLSFFAGIDDCLGKLDGSVAAVLPVLGQCAAYSALSAELSVYIDGTRRGNGIGRALYDALERDRTC